MHVLWYFWIYSFLGYLLEKGFASATASPRQHRSGFLLLPMCPVYGLGMCAVLALPAVFQTFPVIVVTGAVVTTAVEYAVHWGYERLLGVQFWNYDGMPGNLRGRVCVPFAVVWGVLSAAAVLWVQPRVAALAARTVPEITWLVLVVFAADALCAAWVLRCTGNTEALAR